MVGFDDMVGQRVLSLRTPASRPHIAQLSARCELECRVEQFPLAPGDYWIKLGVSARGIEIDEVDRALHFSVIDGEVFGEGRGFYRGLCIAPAHWTRTETD